MLPAGEKSPTVIDDKDETMNQDNNENPRDSADADAEPEVESKVEPKLRNPMKNLYYIVIPSEYWNVFKNHYE